MTDIQDRALTTVPDCGFIPSWMTLHDLQDLRLAREWAATGAALAIRESAGLSLNELARSIDVSPSTVLRWERGEHRPHGACGIRYAQLLQQLTRPARARWSLNDHDPAANRVEIRGSRMAVRSASQV